MGHDSALAAKLILLKKNTSEKYPDVSLWYVFQERIKSIFSDLPSVISLETFDKHRNNFLKFSEVYHDPKKDAITDFCETNEINPFICNSRNKNGHNIAVISKNQTINIEAAKQRFHGRLVIINNIPDSLSAFDAVLGQESPELLSLAAKGMKIYLCPTGIGHISFQKMFPDTELFETTNNR